MAIKSVMSLGVYLYQRTFAISRINGTANLLVTEARTADCCQKAAVFSVTKIGNYGNDQKGQLIQTGQQQKA